MKVAICTLGCKVNQYETQALEQELRHRGHTLTDFEETADIYVVNTCSVTAVSDKKSRQMLRQAKRRNPAAVIAACGCYAQTHPEDVQQLELVVTAGTNDRSHFINHKERAAREKTHIVNVDDVWERREFEVLPAGGMVNRTRAMLKVEDGCVNFCTYCLIPYARGRVRSLPMEEAARQVRVLREEGGVKLEELIGPEDTPCFSMDRITLDNGSCTLEKAACIYIAVEGEGEVRCGDFARAMKRGDYFFLPQAAGQCEVAGNLQLVCCKGGE